MRSDLLCLTLSLIVLSCAFRVRAATHPERGETPPTLAIDMGEGVVMEFVLIPAGTFQMGTDENSGEGDESPIHAVTISRPFYLGRTEVKQSQWSRLMGDNPSRFKGADLPVDTVSWYAAKQFLAAFLAKTGRVVALPTEAQWEYACRAGTDSPWSFGTDETSAAAFAWHSSNSGEHTHPAGTLNPNGWGLHDMHGNVWEWCEDWYNKATYRNGDAADPVGPASGDGRVLRGGAWGDSAYMLRSTARNCAGPDIANHGTGFRCVINLPDAVTPEPARTQVSSPPRSPARSDDTRQSTAK